MNSPFDKIAEAYDDLFTHSAVGYAQRKLVRKYLIKHLDAGKPLRILELNCGTGEDAIYMAKKGHHVLATDISDKMIAQAKSKINHQSKTTLEFITLDINEIKNHQFRQKFDMVISNFGGLNCLNKDQLITLNYEVSKILNKNGRLICILMSDFCMMESLYFIAKRKWDKVFRRKQNQEVALQDGTQQATIYYNPKEFYGVFSNNFKRYVLKPIGFLVPPSYLNNMFEKKKVLLKTLEFMDSNVFCNKIFAQFADHYYIELGKKQ